MARRRRGQKPDNDPVAEAAFIDGLARDPLFVAAQAVLALKIVLVVLIFDPQIIDAFALVKSATAHATSLVLAVLLLALLVIHGRRLVVWSSAHLALGAVVVAFALAAVFALDPVTGFFGIWRRYLGLDQMLDNALLYCAAVVLLPTRRDLMRLCVVSLTTATVVVLYMLIQRLGLDPVTYVQGREIAPPGTFGQPDVSGSYAGIAGVTALGVAIWIPRPVMRIALAVVSLACFAAAIVTNIRGGLIGLGFGWLAVVILVSIWPRDVWPGTKRREATVGLVGAALIATAGVFLSPVGGRFLNLADLVNDRSAQSRVEAWGTAIRLIAQRPLLGLGPDNFGIAYPAFSEKRAFFLNSGETQTSTHNWFLYVATSSGVLGTIAFIALLALVVVFALRLARAGNPAALAIIPLAAFIGQGLVTINDMGTDWIPWLACGAIAGASGRRLVARTTELRPRWMAIVAGVLALVAAAIGVAAANDRVIASDHFGKSESLLAASRGTAAVPEAIAAVEKDPRRAEYWSSLGAALDASDKVVPASAAFAEAARLKPSGVVFWADLALMRLFVQDVHGASLALDRATAADPWDPQSRDLSARVALLLNDADRASREGHLAVELQPTQAGVYEAPVLADIRIGKLTQAEDMLRNGLTIIGPPDSAQLHLLLAQVLHAEKRDADARAEIAAVLAIDPQNKTALQLQQDYK